jgi:heme exporter protein B
MSLFRQAARVAWKDLRIELRSKEIIYTMAFFGALLVIIFTIAFPRDIRLARGAAPGMLWAAIAFAGTIGLGRAFDRERENDTMRALLLSPVPRLSIFLGKAVGICALVILVTIVCTLLLSLLLGLSFFEHPVPLACALFLGAIGFSNVSTVFAATLLRRSRDVLFRGRLPLLVPMFIRPLRDGLPDRRSQTSRRPEMDRLLGNLSRCVLVVSVWTFELVIE